jgi:hypothetical protein
MFRLQVPARHYTLAVLHTAVLPARRHRALAGTTGGAAAEKLTLCPGPGKVHCDGWLEAWFGRLGGLRVFVQSNRYPTLRTVVTRLPWGPSLRRRRPT